MKKRVHIICLCLLSMVLVCGCTAQKDAVFDKEGIFQVECINAKQCNSNNQLQKDYYYYTGSYYEIYRYSYESEKQELLFVSEHTIISYRISGQLLFYTYTEYDHYKVNRVNLETNEEDCIYTNPKCSEVQIYVESDYLYIMVEDDDKQVFRCPINGNFETDAEEVNFYFQTNDGITTDTEQYVKVGNRNVIIKRDRKADAEMPYSYQIEGCQEMPITCFEKSRYDRSRLYQQYMISEDNETIIGIICVSGSPNMSTGLYQRDIRRDMLFSLNIHTGESKILYDTKDNQTRIIGYDSDIIYLFKSDYKIYSQLLTGGKESEIMSVPKSDDVVFDWCGDYLIVRYRDTRTSTDSWPEYELQIIEINS